MSPNNTRPVVMLAQTPPPFHGQAVMTQVLKEALEDSFEVHHVRMAFSETIAENKKLHFSKGWKLVSCLWKTVRLLQKHPGSILYYPPAPGHWVPVLRDIILLSICRPLAGKTVFHFHARGLGDFLNRHRWLPSKPWKNPEHAIVLGPSVRSDAEIISAQNIHEIPYGVDVPFREGDRSQKKVPVIFFAGFHTESKGIFDLLDTARILWDRGVCFEMRTAGEWASEQTRETFFRKRKEYGLEDRVVPAGLLNSADLQAAYAAANLFFFPTFFEHETFGVVVIEAMAHGLPVVASSWPGPIDVVRQNETGILCPARDVEAYADALQNLIEHPEERVAMGEVARALYAKKYTRAQYETSLKTLFLGVCNDEPVC